MSAAVTTPCVAGGMAPHSTSQLWGDKSLTLGGRPGPLSVCFPQLTGALGGWAPEDREACVCPLLAVPASARRSGDTQPGALKKWIRRRVSGG